MALTGRKRDRRLDEPCDFCGVYAGMPCENDYNDHYRFYCPDPECDQLYDSITGAMSCTMHKPSYTKGP